MAGDNPALIPLRILYHIPAGLETWFEFSLKYFTGIFFGHLTGMTDIAPSASRWNSLWKNIIKNLRLAYLLPLLFPCCVVEIDKSDKALKKALKQSPLSPKRKKKMRGSKEQRWIIILKILCSRHYLEKFEHQGSKLQLPLCEFLIYGNHWVECLTLKGLPNSSNCSELQMNWVISTGSFLSPN